MIFRRSRAECITYRCGVHTLYNANGRRKRSPSTIFLMGSKQAERQSAANRERWPPRTIQPTAPTRPVNCTATKRNDRVGRPPIACAWLPRAGSVTSRDRSRGPCRPPPWSPHDCNKEVVKPATAASGVEKTRGFVCLAVRPTAVGWGVLGH